MTNCNDIIKKWWRYPLAMFTGLAIAIFFVFIGIQLASLFGPSSETGYTGMLFGLLFGISIGGFIAGYIVSPVVGLLHHWAKIILITPGVWIALFTLLSQSLEFGISSEYLVELIIPCFIGIILSFYATYKGISQKRKQQETA